MMRKNLSSSVNCRMTRMVSQGTLLLVLEEVQ